jgi:formiminotetrahydrofolate cyclodeaminase
MYDSSKTIEEFLNAAAAKQPTPGGGSITALVGALACAMGEMTIQYSLGKKGLERFQEQFTPALGELQRARRMLIELMVEDQLAYAALTAIRKLPAESSERKEKWPATLLTCIRVPQSIAATCVTVLEKCDQLADEVNYYLLSDLAVCADLSMAAIRCAIYNVRVNMKDLDAADRKSIEESISQIMERALTLIQKAVPKIWDRDAKGA